MDKLRFWIALWGGKVLLWLFKLTGHRKDDRPGMAAVRLCENFMTYVKKPKLTIAVTGTNGKTSISSMIANVLQMDGKKVAYNDWGANHFAGQARLLLDAVNVFNRSTKDVAVIEADELIAPVNVPRQAPNYLIVNNLARDSMIRNAHPAYIQQHLKDAIHNTPNCVLLLNADDPLVCFLGENQRRIYFGVNNLHNTTAEYIVDDFPVCPVCGSKPVYQYRNYRHIGAFCCPECGLKTPKPDYFVEKVDTQKGTLSVTEPTGQYEYPIISSATHNIYNTLALIALLRDMGMEQSVVAEHLKNVRLPASRQTMELANGIEIHTQICKGQNATAASTVFEQIGKDSSTKEVILLLDEVFENPHKTETSAWIYDTDYEFLNSEAIKRIIVGGDRYLDHRLRLLLAGIPQDKIVCMQDMLRTPEHLLLENDKAIYILHDVNSVSRGRAVRDAVKNRIVEEKRGNV